DGSLLLAAWSTLRVNLHKGRGASTQPRLRIHRPGLGTGQGSAFGREFSFVACFIAGASGMAARFQVKAGSLHCSGSHLASEHPTVVIEDRAGKLDGILGDD